ncbi:WYL domain-containing protein [Limosilactobacillus equigenerosi]|uniref:Uncharacterized protein n=1 Tax=Limosilactobacillus equigenerosi DSM 18793 = JCM 14505 TaxID=1423742 RepID=A0A0R1UT87_9LACO|nr:WYL domain-containing protein [Limosilactobacillus equigenerosi]KRL96385.1 hypothetical protein FC21_GL000184 [Limosilactobacillus equigenerosi DSM 18793 = JCM 14505]
MKDIEKIEVLLAMAVDLLTTKKINQAKYVEKYRKLDEKGIDDESIRHKIQRDIKDLRGYFANNNYGEISKLKKGNYELNGTGLDELMSGWVMLDDVQKAIVIEVLADIRLLSKTEFAEIAGKFVSSDKPILFNEFNNLMQRYRERYSSIDINTDDNEYMQSIFEKLSLLYETTYLDKNGRAKQSGCQVEVLKVAYQDREFEEHNYSVIANEIAFRDHHLYLISTEVENLGDNEWRPIKDSRRNLRLDRIINVKKTNISLSMPTNSQDEAASAFTGQEKIVFECYGDAILPALDRYIDWKQLESGQNNLLSNKVTFYDQHGNKMDKQTNLKLQVQRSITHSGKAIFEIRDSLEGTKIWLLSQGENVKVIQNDDLKKKMKSSLQGALAYY